MKTENKILTAVYNRIANKKSKELIDNVKLSKKLDKQFKNS